MSLDCKASMQRTVHIAPPNPCNGKSPLVANEGKVTDETLTRQGGTSYSDQWVPLHGPLGSSFARLSLTRCTALKLSDLAASLPYPDHSIITLAHHIRSAQFPPLAMLTTPPMGRLPRKWSIAEDEKLREEVEAQCRFALPYTKYRFCTTLFLVISRTSTSFINSSPIFSLPRPFQRLENCLISIHVVSSPTCCVFHGITLD
jgi:hypothetical protein